MSDWRKSKKKLRPETVCPNCQGYMERKTSIREGVGGRFWGDDKPFLNVGGKNVRHFICIKCGNVSAYQESGLRIQGLGNRG